MTCTACGHANRPGAKFCEECATPLARRCASCGSELRPTAKFCDECGEQVGGRGSRLRPEAFGGGARRAADRPEDGSAGASPSREDDALPPLDNWVRYWKSQFSKRGQNPERCWQPDHWDTRLRHEESYDAKWEYVRNNPVRAGLVVRPEDWPYSGELFALRW